MYIEQVSLVDFRNHAATTLNLGQGVTTFLGSNGQGKTNLLEALRYLSVFGSHRTATDKPLIRSGADAAIVRGTVRNGPRGLLIETQINRTGANLVRLAGHPAKIKDVSGRLLTVLFAPEDLTLLRGDPTARRQFLDDLVRELSPRMVETFSRFDRVVRQRNSLLKSLRAIRTKSTASDSLQLWNDRLIAYGAAIITARAKLITELEPHMVRTYREISGTEAPIGTSVAVSFLPDPVSSESLLDQRWVETELAAGIERMAPVELDRGATLVGPHRDDWLLSLNGLAARTHASHGETWSYALALRLASAELLRERSIAGDPVLMLDDVFAELDATRRRRLAGAIAGYEQVLITAAVIEDVPTQLTGTVLQVQEGTVLDG